MPWTCKNLYALAEQFHKLAEKICQLADKMKSNFSKNYIKMQEIWNKVAENQQKGKKNNLKTGYFLSLEVSFDLQFNSRLLIQSTNLLQMILKNPQGHWSHLFHFFLLLCSRCSGTLFKCDKILQEKRHQHMKISPKIHSKLKLYWIQACALRIIDLWICLSWLIFCYLYSRGFTRN